MTLNDLETPLEEIAGNPIVNMQIAGSRQVTTEPHYYTGSGEINPFIAKICGNRGKLL